MWGKRKGEKDALMEAYVRWEERRLMFRTFMASFLITLAICIAASWAVKYLANRFGYEQVKYPQLFSRLENQELCYLCGDDPRSMSAYYRQFDTLGFVSLNDWYMIDVDSQTKAGHKKEAGMSDTVLRQVDTGFLKICTTNSAADLRSVMEVSWDGDMALDTTLIEEKLCQRCLEKVTESLTVQKYFCEDKQPMPFCLVDFQTLEVYSVQDWRTEYCIRDFQVDLSYPQHAIYPSETKKIYCAFERNVLH